MEQQANNLNSDQIKIVGIEFGTTKAVLSYMNNTPEMIPSEIALPEIPAILAFLPDQRVFSE